MIWRAIAAIAILGPKLLAQPTSAAPNSAVQAVPLTQIAARDEDLRRILRDISEHLPLTSELDEFEQQLASREKAVRTGLSESDELLAGSATIMEIREHARQWRASGGPEARQRKTLARWGTVCDQNIAVLKQHEAVWSATLVSTQALEASASVQDRVRKSLSEIESVKATAEERLRTIVELQGRVSKQATAIADMIEKLGNATQSFQKRLFHADAPPLWSRPTQAHGGQSAASIFRTAIGRSYLNSSEFVQNEKELVWATALLLATAMAISQRLRRALNNARPLEARLARASDILRRWFALSVLMTAPLVLGWLPVGRMSFVLLIIQVFLLPLWRLSPLILGCSRRVAVFVTVFYALHSVLWILGSELLFGRALNAGLFAVTLGVLAWWGRPSILRRAVESPARGKGELLRVRATFAALALILVSNIFGFVLLSNFLRVVFVLTSYLGLTILLQARAISILVAASTRLKPMNTLATIRLHEAAVLRWVPRALSIVAVFWWLSLVLDLLALRSDVSKLIAAALDAKIGIKGFGLTLGNLLACLGLLVGGLLAARGVRFVIRNEILSRVRLSRGVAETVATSVYYISLVLVLLMSLVAAGVQLDKLTVLTGAFGVGVGFGMQNIIANFVSGLVLQFERPIRIGDVLEIGNLAGEVQHIGARASLIRTFQGADVIVPNSNLVSNQVVNWTLSEPIRRVDLQVPVAYGTAPERVIQLLAGIARSHPGVLRDPEPGAFFQGFGPNSLDFIVMFWAEQQTHFQLRSDIAIAVNSALHEAGIEIPLPQREIRVLGSESPRDLRAAAPEASNSAAPRVVHAA